MDGAQYDEDYYRSNGQLGDRPALRLYTRLVRRYIGRSPVLDVGCGTGHLLAHLSADGPADGVELSEFSAATARVTSPSSTVYTRAEDLPAGRYPAMTAIHVFEHIPDDALGGLVDQLRHASTADGRALVVMPDRDGLAHRLHGAAWNALTDPTHINLKSHQEWRSFFDEHGVEVLHEGTDGLWNFPYRRLPRLLDALVHGLPMAAQFLLGRMVLRPGRGESCFFVVRWNARSG